MPSAKDQSRFSFQLAPHLIFHFLISNPSQHKRCSTYFTRRYIALLRPPLLDTVPIFMPLRYLPNLLRYRDIDTPSNELRFAILC